MCYVKKQREINFLTWVLWQDKLNGFTREETSGKNTAFGSRLNNSKYLVESKEKDSREDPIEVTVTSMKQESY